MPRVPHDRKLILLGGFLLTAALSACADELAPRPATKLDAAAGMPSSDLATASADTSAAGPPVYAAVTSWPSRLVPGQQQRLQARAWDSAGREVTAPNLTWFSTAPSIVTVDANGNATARALGTTAVGVQVRRSDSKLAATVRTPMVVQSGPPAAVAQLVVSPTMLRLVPGDSAVLSITVRGPAGQSIQRCAYQFGSSNVARATVRAPGVVNAVSAGPLTTIVVICQNQWVQIPVVVSPKRSQPAVVATSPVEALGVVSAAQVRNGLGFNVDPQQPWQLQLAKDVGAREVRMQFPWNWVETIPGRLELPQSFRASLASAGQLGLRPLINAAYGPNWNRLPAFTLRSPAAVGDTVISLVPSPALTDVARGYSYVQRADGAQVVSEGYWAYAGAYVSSVRSGASQIVLAAPLTVALQSGDQLMVNNRFYKPPVPGDANDPSLAAYMRYTRFLADQIASAGAGGQVEIWNEPPWINDRWDGGEGCFFATATERSKCQDINYTFARALLNTTAPNGVRYTWGGTHKTGFATLIGGASAGEFRSDVTRQQIENSVTEESFHPYGASPEDHAWDPKCLARPGVANIYAACSLTGTIQGSNIKWARKVAIAHQNQTGWTINQTVSEAGLYTSNALAKARYLLRFYLASHALGLTRVDFYRLVDGPSGTANWGVVDATTRNPTLPFRSLQGLMQQVDGLATTPAAAYDTASLPSVSAAQTTWPVTTATIVGRATPGAARNTVVLTLWQRTYPKISGQTFDQLPPTPVGRVAVRVPTGYAAVRAWSLVDQSAVSITTRDASTVELLVGDDPIAIRFDPK